MKQVAYFNSEIYLQKKSKGENEYFGEYLYYFILLLLFIALFLIDVI